MKNITALATGALAAVTMSGVLAGCTPTTEQPYTGSAPATPTVWTGSPAPNPHANESGGYDKPAEGATLHQYIVDNNIAEVPIKPDEPGTPKINFPFPPDWRAAGDQKPDWAYGAIVYDKAVDANDPPFLYAIASKLTGNVDPAKILDLAGGQLNDLPEFKPVEGTAPKRTKFDGYDAVSYTGTYTWEGKRRGVGQETIVIPGNGALFVLQLNGEAPSGQEQVVIDAVKLIRDQTQITLPS